MSYAEARRIGLNEETLRRIKERAKKDRKITLYNKTLKKLGLF